MPIIKYPYDKFKWIDSCPTSSIPCDDFDFMKNLDNFVTTTNKLSELVMTNAANIVVATKSDNDTYKAVVELPGYNKDTIIVEDRRTHLQVETLDKKKKFLINFPVEVDTWSMDVTCKDGLLTFIASPVTYPKIKVK